MFVKNFENRRQPIQVYIVLVMTLLFFAVQVMIFLRSKSTTLLLDAYHMFCNIIGLIGCLITFKSRVHETRSLWMTKTESTDKIRLDDAKKPLTENTFGWARVDIFTMVIVWTFLAGLSLSTVLQAFHSLADIIETKLEFHVEHKESFHPYKYENCLKLGVVGLLLNGICFWLIGGYTFHQGSFRHLTSEGNISTSIALGRRSQEIHDIARDVCSSVIVIAASTIIVCFQESHLVQLVDPLMALVSVALLLSLNYPYIRAPAKILLQKIPENIEIEIFQKELLKTFPEIHSIHDFHIWQLTQQKFVSTAHIIFLDPTDYKVIINDVLGFFHEQGIENVTIQPEFKNLESTIIDSCLVSCQSSWKERLDCRTNNKHDKQLEQVILEEPWSLNELASNLDGYPGLNGSIEDQVSDLRKAHSEHKQVIAKTLPASLKKIVSESVIRSGEYDHLHRQDSDILIENRMLKQLDTTDNTETEDLYERCDKET